MLRQLLTIARNTFTEAIRQPIFTVLVLAGSGLLVLSTMWTAYTLSDDNKMLLDTGLWTVWGTCLLLAALTATGVLSEEIESRTVLTVVSKPVPRPLFVLGKFLGVAAAIAAAFWLLTLVFAFCQRHGVMQTASDQFDVPVLILGVGAALAATAFAGAVNYLYRWVFTSTFVVSLLAAETLAAALLLLIGQDWTIQNPLAPFTADGAMAGQIAFGLIMIFEAVLILTAVAIAASTRLGQVATLLICAGVFFVGLISNSFSQFVNTRLNVPPGTGPLASTLAVFSAEGPAHLKLLFAGTKVLYLALPNLQFLWPGEALTQGFELTPAMLAIVTAYAACYIGVVLALAIALFQTREVG